jgi:hypothetical protein
LDGNKLTGLSFVTDMLLLEGGVEDYEYLNKSRREVDGVNDREEWNGAHCEFLSISFLSIHLTHFRAPSMLLVSPQRNSSIFSRRSSYLAHWKHHNHVNSCRRRSNARPISG